MAAGGTTFTVSSITGFNTNDLISINGSSTEFRTITATSSTASTITVDVGLKASHPSGSVVSEQHNLTSQLPLDFFKPIGSYDDTSVAGNEYNVLAAAVVVVGGVKSKPGFGYGYTGADNAAVTDINITYLPPTLRFPVPGGTGADKTTAADYSITMDVTPNPTGGDPSTNFKLGKNVLTVTIDSQATPTFNSSRNITGTYVDPLFPVDIDKIDVNGVTATVNTTGKTYNANVSLGVGSNTITATYTDKAGNIGTASTAIVRLEEPPPPVSTPTPPPVTPPVTPPTLIPPVTPPPIPPPATPIPQAVIQEAIESVVDAQAEAIQEVVEGLAPTVVVASVQEASTETKVKFAENVNTETLTAVAENVNNKTLKKVAENINTETLKKIAENVNTETLKKIAENVNNKTLTEIAENVNNKTKVDIVNEVNTPTKVKLLKNVSKNILGQILQNVKTEELKKIPQKDLVEQLSTVAPTESYIPDDEAPQAALNQAKPNKVAETDTMETVLLAGITTGWTENLIASPAPVDTLQAEFARELASVSVTLENVSEKPFEVPDLPENQTVSEYFRIDVTNVEPGDILTARLGFYVEKSWVEENNIHKWSIQLNRFNEETGEWVVRPAKKVSEDDTRVHYTTVLPGLSLFAISGSEALPPIQFSVSDLAIFPDEAPEGDRVTISARVTNLTENDLVFPASLWFNNTVESAREISVSAGGTTFYFFAVKKPVGTYNVRVDRLLGQFTVAQVPTPITPTPVTPTPITPTPVTPTPVTPTPVTPAPITPTPVTPTPTAIPTPSVTIVPVTPTPTPTLAVVPPTPSDGGFPVWLLIVLVFVGAALLIIPAAILRSRG